jgi:CHAT domain-containing protein
MRRTVVRVLAVAAALLCTAALIQLSGRGAQPGLVQQLARNRPERSFAPRLSIPTRYHRCTPQPAESGEAVGREACGTRGKGSPNPVDLGDYAIAGESAHPDSLQASALAAVIWWDETKPEALDRAIERLVKARRLSTRPVPLLVDLAAVHLVRAERTQTSQDLLMALEYANEALELEPRNVFARFNAALAMQAIGLDEEADSAWNAYLELDSRSPWADEARRRKRVLITTAAEIPRPAVGASEKEVAEFAARYPQEARELGWDRVLGDWGTAVEKGEAARADALLELAERLGRALERRRGGDVSLADAVRAIRGASADAAATARLAQAHRAFAEGQSQFLDLDAPASFAAFTRVISSRPPSPALLHWAAVFRARALEYLRERDAAKSALRALLTEVDSARHPAVAGRARLMMGAIGVREGEYAEARAQLRSAAERLRDAGEPQHAGFALSMDGEVAYQQGDTIQAYRSMHRAQRALRSYRSSVRLHSQLHALARYAAMDGMPRAALSIHDENVRVARRGIAPINVVDALQLRAETRTILGDSAGAVSDLVSAAALVPQLADEKQREWYRAVISVANPEAVSAVVMDAAVEYFTTANNLVWLVPALIRRADARLREGDLVGATHDLKTVTDSIRGLSGKESNLRFRAAMIEQARSRFDRLVMLYLRMNRPVDALRALERARLSFAGQQGDAQAGEDRLSEPPGEVALEYALIGDTLLTWTLRGDSLYPRQRIVDRDTFMLTVEQTVAALEAPGRAEQAAPGLRRLYDWLIRPVRGQLGRPETPLVILADGEIAGIPFAALMDEDRNDRYLVQDHPLRFAATLADAARPARGRSGPALLVADPAFDLNAYSTLYRLEGARAEVDSLLRYYPGAVPLAGEDATRGAFVARARSAGVIHYAGHAVFDDARPDRSYMVLAGADTTGRLTAEAVHGMRLDGVRLVVLSACRTLRSREGRSGGFAGLSGAMLAAGAGGVVGSLWQVRDGSTQPLMVAFHREHLRTRDPARALRDAQLWMLRHAPAGELRSPAAWAGFRYTGSRGP